MEEFNALMTLLWAFCLALVPRKANKKALIDP